MNLKNNTCGFKDSYRLKISFQDEEGLTWKEYHENFSLQDCMHYIEVCEHHIIKVEMGLMK